MKTGFKDHFSGASEDYGRYRPSYPAALFKYLSAETNNHNRAWDCATGTGQSAISLSHYYTEVIATDASETQIQKAVSRPGVVYRVALAEESKIESNSVDLITVAQALHWFKLDKFSREVNRVLKPEGVLAVWAYGLLKIQPDIDAIVNDLYGRVLDPYWPEERKMVENGYNNIQFPFQYTEKSTPVFNMDESWNLSQLTGYLNTWSAVKRYIKETGINPVDNIQKKLSSCWGKTDKPRSVKWPLILRLWSK